MDANAIKDSIGKHNNARILAKKDLNGWLVIRNVDLLLYLISKMIVSIMKDRIMRLDNAKVTVIAL